MKDLNKVILRGVVADRPESRSFEGGGKVVNLSVNTVTEEPDGDGTRDQQAWHRVSARGKNADTAETLAEGAPVYVEGQLRTRKYENRDGQQVEASEVRANIIRGVRSAEPNRNQAILLGAVGRKGELRQQESFTVSNLRVAIGEERFRRTDAGFESYPETAWYSVAAFGDLAETADREIDAGHRVFVEGFVRTRKYTDRNGDEQRTTEVVARTLFGNECAEPPPVPEDDDDPPPPGARDLPDDPPPAEREERDDDGDMEEGWL